MRCPKALFRLWARGSAGSSQCSVGTGICLSASFRVTFGQPAIGDEVLKPESIDAEKKPFGFQKWQLLSS
ncbi:MAG: hypothetical protein FJW26_08040 [Acidimicrobiia bacterium]|nr:hypothetical protein [Acidimicrobiia bacterium]